MHTHTHRAFISLFGVYANANNTMENNNHQPTMPPIIDRSQHNQHPSVTETMESSYLLFLLLFFCLFGFVVVERKEKKRKKNKNEMKYRS